jgi:hypothetical protein
MQADPTRDRAYLVTEKITTGNVVTATVLTVINTTTGNPVATPLTYTGSEIDTLTLNPDHTRALFIYYDIATGATRATIINTNTGAQTGQILNLPAGFTGTILFTGDSTRAAILTGGNTKTGPTTTLTTINLGTNNDQIAV